jgi:hypothetical protein
LELSYLYGKFSKTDKGNKLFEITDKKDASHLLIREDWGGWNETYKGRALLPIEHQYWHRTTWYGGKAGYDFIVIDKNYQRVIDEDSI